MENIKDEAVFMQPGDVIFLNRIQSSCKNISEPGSMVSVKFNNTRGYYCHCRKGERLVFDVQLTKNSEFVLRRPTYGYFTDEGTGDIIGIEFKNESQVDEFKRAFHKVNPSKVTSTEIKKVGVGNLQGSAANQVQKSIGSQNSIIKMTTTFDPSLRKLVTFPEANETESQGRMSFGNSIPEGNQQLHGCSNELRDKFYKNYEAMNSFLYQGQGQLWRQPSEHSLSNMYDFLHGITEVNQNIQSRGMLQKQNEFGNQGTEMGMSFSDHVDLGKGQSGKQQSEHYISNFDNYAQEFTNVNQNVQPRGALQKPNEFGKQRTEMGMRFSNAILGEGQSVKQQSEHYLSNFDNYAQEFTKVDQKVQPRGTLKKQNEFVNQRTEIGMSFSNQANLGKGQSGKQQSEHYLCNFDDYEQEFTKVSQNVQPLGTLKKQNEFGNKRTEMGMSFGKKSATCSRPGEIISSAISSHQNLMPKETNPTKFSNVSDDTEVCNKVLKRSLITQNQNPLSKPMPEFGMTKELNASAMKHSKYHQTSKMTSTAVRSDTNTMRKKSQGLLDQTDKVILKLDPLKKFDNKQLMQGNIGNKQSAKNCPNGREDGENSTKSNVYGKWLDGFQEVWQTGNTNTRMGLSKPVGPDVVSMPFQQTNEIENLASMSQQNSLRQEHPQLERHFEPLSKNLEPLRPADHGYIKNGQVRKQTSSNINKDMGGQTIFQSQNWNEKQNTGRRMPLEFNPSELPFHQNSAAKSPAIKTRTDLLIGETQKFDHVGDQTIQTHTTMSDPAPIHGDNYNPKNCKDSEDGRLHLKRNRVQSAGYGVSGDNLRGLRDRELKRANFGVLEGDNDDPYNSEDSEDERLHLARQATQFAVDGAYGDNFRVVYSQHSFLTIDRDSNGANIEGPGTDDDDPYNWEDSEDEPLPLTMQSTQYVVEGAYGDNLRVVDSQHSFLTGDREINGANFEGRGGDNDDPYNCEDSEDERLHLMMQGTESDADVTIVSRLQTARILLTGDRVFNGEGMLSEPIPREQAHNSSGKDILTPASSTKFRFNKY